MEAPKTAFQSSSTGWSWGGLGRWGWSSLLDKSSFSFSRSSFPETITEDPAGLEWGKGEAGSLDECPGRHCLQTGSLGAWQPLVLGDRKGVGVSSKERGGCYHSHDPPSLPPSSNSAGAQTTYSDRVPISTPTYRDEVEYLSQTADLLGVWPWASHSGSLYFHFFI